MMVLDVGLRLAAALSTLNDTTHKKLPSANGSLERCVFAHIESIREKGISGEPSPVRRSEWHPTDHALKWFGGKPAVLSVP